MFLEHQIFEARPFRFCFVKVNVNYCGGSVCFKNDCLWNSIVWQEITQFLMSYIFNFSFAFGSFRGSKIVKFTQNWSCSKASFISSMKASTNGWYAAFMNDSQSNWSVWCNTFAETVKDRISSSAKFLSSVNFFSVNYSHSSFLEINFDLESSTLVSRYISQTKCIIFVEANQVGLYTQTLLITSVL